MRFLLLISLLIGLITAQDLTFVNPEPEGEVGDYAQNPTFVLGSSINIQWTDPGSRSIAMVLYQQREGDQFEYVFANQVNITSYRWNVGTSKSLSNGNIFFFQIFYTGDTGPSATSHYFNMSRGTSDDDSNTTSSGSSTASATASSTSSSITPTVTPTASNTATSDPSSGGLSTGAKVGMGVGIPIAVIIGVAAGWFLFGRRRNKAGSNDLPNTPVPDYAPNAMSEQSAGIYKPPNANLAPSEIYTPPTEPTEMPGNNGIGRY